MWNSGLDQFRKPASLPAVIKCFGFTAAAADRCSKRLQAIQKTGFAPSAALIPAHFQTQQLILNQKVK